jgi:hypothetical protein
MGNTMKRMMILVSSTLVASSASAAPRSLEQLEKDLKASTAALTVINQKISQQQHDVAKQEQLVRELVTVHTYEGYLQFLAEQEVLNGMRVALEDMKDFQTSVEARIAALKAAIEQCRRPESRADARTGAAGQDRQAQWYGIWTGGW